MVLTYGTYLDLLTAIDEHTHCTLTKTYIQNIIFKHCVDKYGSFVAVNYNGVKRLFYIQMQKNKNNNHQMKIFRNFMNNDKH